MSPELYSKIKGKRKEPVGDLKQNDHFALGQTLLSLYTGSQLNEIYRPNGDFDHTKEQELISLMRRNAKDKKLAWDIEQLINENSQSRKDYIQQQAIDMNWYNQKQ